MQLRLAGSLFVLSLVLTSSAYAQVYGQTTPSDRRTFIGANASTTDDPRHIPNDPKPRGPAGFLVLRGGRIFDSVKKSAYPGTLVIERNHIVSILAPDSTTWPADAKVLDVTGKTVLPGLIDMHVHLTYPDSTTIADEVTEEGAGTLRGLANAQNFLRHGITTVRDMNGVRNAPYILSSWMAEDRAPGPRIFTAGHIITGTGGHAADRPITGIHSAAFTREADGPIEWRKAVRETFKEGANVIKIASLFSPDEVRAAVEEAHALGLRVTCDCETFYIKWAVEAGVDMIEHPLPRTDETIKLMAEHHTDSDPTLQVYQNLVDGRGGYYNTPSRRFTLGSQQDFDIFKKMKSAGIRLGIGTDTIGDNNATVPNVYIAELKWFVKGGFTIPEALIAATRTNAQMLDIADKLGTLEPGKLADVLVVEGTPDSNIDDLLRVDKVIRDGYVMVDGGFIQVPNPVVKPLIKPAPPADIH
jgi:imidazolonepropionase-like amidohydrolase